MLTFRDTVKDIMTTIDPEGYEFRRKRKLRRTVYYSGGPNDQWCFDGHDKIVKYGFAISGCVDAWSGKIIWLSVFTGNHDPRLIAKYYLEAIKEHGGIFLSQRSISSDHAK